MREKHFKDWTALDDTKRLGAWERCQSIAKSRQKNLSAFLEIVEASGSSVSGSLIGLPYAAKDMFLSPERKPTWGLADFPHYALLFASPQGL